MKYRFHSSVSVPLQAVGYLDKGCEVCALKVSACRQIPKQGFEVTGDVLPGHEGIFGGPPVGRIYFREVPA